MFTAASVYGTAVQAPNYGIAEPTQHMGTDDIATGWRGLVDPHNPLMWFGVILLVTIGAAGVAGSVRLGRARIHAGVGESSKGDG